MALGLCLLAGCGGGASNNPSARGDYLVTDLGIAEISDILPGYSSAARVNDLGQVVGPPTGIGCGTDVNVNCYQPPSFLYSNGTLVNLSSKLGLVTDINNRGQIAGIAATGTGQSQAAILENGNVTDLVGLSTGPGGGSDANAINDLGQVVGDSLAPGGGLHAVLWQNGKVTDLGTIGNTSGYSTMDSATDINNRGQIVGYYSIVQDAKLQMRAFLWQNGKMVDLGTLGGNGGSQALAINDPGQVIGVSSAMVAGVSSLDGFLWQNGRMTDLSAQTGKPFRPMGINNTGQIAGTAAIGSASTSTGTTIIHAFLWQNGKLTDLNSLLPANSGWVLNVASSINDRGQICGSGMHNGQYRLFLLNPSISLP